MRYVETPFVDKGIIDKCIAVCDNDYDAIIVRTPGGIHPLCGIYSRSLEKPLLKMLHEGEHKLTKLLQNSSVFYLDIEDENALLNMNTPDDYEKALRIQDEHRISLLSL